MRLSELVSSLGLWVFPVVGLLGFTGAFVVIVLGVARRTRGEMSARSALPLEDGTASAAAGVRAAGVGAAEGGER